MTTITVATVEAPAPGTKRPHKITDTAGTTYKTFDPAVAQYLREHAGADVDIETTLTPGKPGYPAEPFITQATLAIGSQPAAAPGGQHIPHAVGDERIESRRVALRSAVRLAAANIIAVDRILAAADHFTAWIYEQESGIVLIPNATAPASSAAVERKPAGGAVSVDMQSKIVAATRAVAPQFRTAFLSDWLPKHGYVDYQTFVLFGAEHADAALEFLNTAAVTGLTGAK